MLKKYIAVTFSGEIARVAISTLGGALLARALGPDGRGLYALAILVPRTAETVFRFGQHGVNSTFAGLYRDQRPALFAQTVLFALVLGSMSALAVAAWFFWLPTERSNFADLPLIVMMIAVLLAPTEMLRNMLMELARGSERITSTVVITAFSTLLLTAGIFVFLWCLGFGLQAAMWITLGVPIITIALHLVQVRDFATIDPRRLSWPIMQHSLQFGGIVTLSTIAMFLIPRASMYLFGYMAVSNAEIGLFAVALNVADQLRIVPTSVASAFLPTLSNNREVRQRQTPMVCRYTAIASWAMAFGLVLIGPPLMVILFGWDYLGSVVPFLAMLPGLAVFGSARVLGMDLWVRNRPQYGMINNWITLTITVVVTILLIPPLGITGAAIASSVGLLVLSGLTVWAYKRESGFPYRELLVTREDFRGMRRQLLEMWHRLRSRIRKPNVT